ncbi:hypothetical protein cand_016500 [Cryptosporidium andersoni]|uniref:Uncharacterized protein n=1 Tax=Cryptosporidium andersoni TaxID=117008 RepID=A0A1J4MTB9_9CRYT|nr:hypothetical protein cand_016500 [Cryptosporidium andersoni]
MIRNRPLMLICLQLVLYFIILQYKVCRLITNNKCESNDLSLLETIRRDYNLMEFAKYNEELLNDKILEIRSNIEILLKLLTSLKNNIKVNFREVQNLVGEDLSNMKFEIPNILDILTAQRLELINLQIKKINMITSRLLVYWHAEYNMGFDIESSESLDMSFLDMIGLGDESIWDTSSLGGKVSRAIDHGADIYDKSVDRLISKLELYRYIMVYNYIRILGVIFRKPLDYEKIIRKCYATFKAVKEQISETRDSISLILQQDLPSEPTLPEPIATPSFLDIRKYCNTESYNDLVARIDFFREIQDNYKHAIDNIKREKCINHELRGCSLCESRKYRILLCEWSIHDLEIDIKRLESNLSICFNILNKRHEETIKQINLDVYSELRKDVSFDSTLESETPLSYSPDNHHSYNLDEKSNSNDRIARRRWRKVILVIKFINLFKEMVYLSLKEPCMKVTKGIEGISTNVKNKNSKFHMLGHKVIINQTNEKVPIPSSKISHGGNDKIRKSSLNFCNSLGITKYKNDQTKHTHSNSKVNNYKKKNT